MLLEPLVQKVTKAARFGLRILDNHLMNLIDIAQNSRRRIIPRIGKLIDEMLIAHTGSRNVQAILKTNQETEGMMRPWFQRVDLYNTLVIISVAEIYILYRSPQEFEEDLVSTKVFL